MGMGALALGGRNGFAAAAKPKKKLLTVFVSGGWDATYSLDAKGGASGVDVPAGEAKSLGKLTYFGHESRPNARAFFEAHGALTTIVNGIQVQSINHPDCAKRMLTGTASDANPDFSTITAFELGQERSAPLLALGPTAFTGNMGSVAVRTGTVTQLKTLLDPAYAFPAPEGVSTRFIPSKGEAKAIDQYARASAEALLGGRAKFGRNRERAEDYLASRERGEAFKRFSDAFSEELEFALDLRVQIDIAVRALSEGLSQSVHLETPFGWDTHVFNEAQGPLQEDLFDALTSLVDKLADADGEEPGNKLIDETLIVVVSEMGRTPKLNADAGKDHWPVTSALLIGGGTAGGRTLGATDDKLQSAPIDFETGAASSDGKVLQVGNFAAGILTAVGVDASAYLPNSEAFHALSV